LCVRTRVASLLGVVLVGMALAPQAAAQQADSARARAGTARTDTAARRIPRAPLSPRRAFIYSAVVPGYAQSVLGRPNAAALFVLAEVATVTMIRQTAANAREARRLSQDSIVVSTVDSVTGQPRTVLGPPRYPAELVAARRAQLEDWIAALVANHLFAGADAFVAAHLWDVPAQLSLRALPGRTMLAARVRW